jgi:replication-associated recombination protein RarA
VTVSGVGLGDARNLQAGGVPLPLRSIRPYQRNKLRDGDGYRYLHNDPSGFVAQEYRPPTSL